MSTRAHMEQQKEQKQKIIKRALLVEDYEACHRFMSIDLQNLGYQVDLAIDSLTAIQTIDSKTYDLIIVDINLHGHKLGEKIIKKIRKSNLNIGTDIIAWSAYFNKNNDEKYSVWGADVVLVKSCGFEGLKNAIWKCSLTPRNEREFYYKLKILRKKSKDSGSPNWIKKINDLRHVPFHILYEAVHLIKEYQR